jgi:hypothetical protein
LIVNDGANNTSLEYGTHSTATDGYDAGLDQYAPPAPPAGSFDARFSKDGEDYIKDFRGPIQEGENIVWNLSFQASTGNAPVILEWSPAQFPAEGTFMLQDPYGGNIVNLNMREVSTYTDTESAPNELQIVYSMLMEVEQSFSAGWNLMSLPIERGDAGSSVSELYPDAINGTLFSYNGAYVSETELIPGQGYWLRFNEDRQYTLTGSELSSLTIELNQGWNMIGAPSTVTDINAISDPGNIIINGTLFGYNGSYYVPGSFDSGEGYWIRASAAGSITIGAEGKSMAKSSLPELSQYPSLSFENGQGLRQMLSFAVELPKEINLLSYSLPPVAPKAVLDVRFDGDLSILSASEGRFTLSSESAVNLTTSNLPADKSYQIENLQTGEIHPLDNSQISLSKGSYQLSETIALPMEFIVEPNYPNPFNPVTNIRYGLPEASQVSIQIFNVQGQLVRTLFSAEQPAGYHTIQWNGRNDFGSQLGSGVYFYRVQSGKDKMIKKMLLVK